MLAVASFPLQLLLAFSPAPDLLLAHLQEEGLLLVLVEGVQHVGVDVHVLQDLLQHAGGRVGGAVKPADTLDRTVVRQTEMLSSGPTASGSLLLYSVMVLQLGLPPVLFIHTLVACPLRSCSANPASSLRCAPPKMSLSFVFGRQRFGTLRGNTNKECLNQDLKSECRPTGHAVGLKLIQDSPPGDSRTSSDPPFLN